MVLIQNIAADKVLRGSPTNLYARNTVTKGVFPLW